MKFIEPSFELLPQNSGRLEEIYKQIEIAGRTCYKSEDKITEDSCNEFVQRMIDNGHTAMLEHGTVYLTIPVHEWYAIQEYLQKAFPKNCPWVKINSDDYLNFYITTNYRHCIENKISDALLKNYMCEPTKYHHKRVSVRFICDRGVSHKRFVA